MGAKGIYIWNGTQFVMLGSGETMDPSDPGIAPVFSQGTSLADDLNYMNYTFDNFQRPQNGDSRLRGYTAYPWENTVAPNVVAAQAANPSTPVQITVSQITSIPGPAILTFPPGIFEFPNGFANFPGNSCMSIGPNRGTQLYGMVGSGANRTTLRMNGKVSRAAGVAPTGDLFSASGATNAYIAGFTLQGTQIFGDNVFHAGMVISNCSNVIVEGIRFKGVAPGYNSAPPGETFQYNVLRSNNFTIKDCEIDGSDINGTPTCASHGTNNCDNFKLYRVVAHHGLIGMQTSWETVNVYTEDYHVYSYGYLGTLGGDGRYYAGAQVIGGASHGMNHEMAEGTITHVRPVLDMVAGRTSNVRNGAHMTMNGTHVQVAPGFRVEEPRWGKVSRSSTGMFVISCEVKYHPGAAGRYGLSDWATRWGFQYNDGVPTVIKNGVSLPVKRQVLPQNVSTTANPVTDQSQIVIGAGDSGWNSSSPTGFFAMSNG